MNAEKILKDLLKEFQNEFKTEPAKNSIQQTFREGVLFAMRLAIIEIEDAEREAEPEQEDN